MPRWTEPWTPERIAAEAARFDRRSEWAKASPGSYSAARRFGIVDEVAAHMEQTSKPRGWWTLERCREEAQRYGSRGEWSRSNFSSYMAAWRHRWLDLCQHGGER
jgi:hypothetical protein